MASVAPTRFATELTDGAERAVYWETAWVPTSAPGLWVAGDQTLLSAAGEVTFLDCHVLPGATHVAPFGEWTAAETGSVAAAPLALEWVRADGSVVATTQALDGALRVAVPEGGAVRVVLSSVSH